MERQRNVGFTSCMQDVLNHEEVSIAGRNMSKNEEVNLPVYA
jgi:hypothetical protein